LVNEEITEYVGRGIFCVPLYAYIILFSFQCVSAYRYYSNCLQYLQNVLYRIVWIV